MSTMTRIHVNYKGNKNEWWVFCKYLAANSSLLYITVPNTPDAMLLLQCTLVYYHKWTSWYYVFLVK